MVERVLTLRNQSGLHARPAALFVQAVQRFPGTEVTVVKGEQKANGRSLLSLLALGAEQGTTLTLRCTGPQAQEALDALGAVLAGGLGE